MFNRSLTWALAIAASIGLARPALSQIVISEFMASNTRTLADEDREYSDWIELLNAGSADLNLNGWSLTDEPDSPRKWRLPAINIGPGETLVVFASGKNRHVPGEELHTNFKLGAEGDFLGISDPSGAIVHSYGTNYPQQLPDVSFGFVAEEELVTLIPADAPLRFLRPPAGGLPEIWRFLEFDDAGWTRATNGIGFDATSAGVLTPEIRSDISSVRDSAGVFVRYHFNVASADLAPLLLRIKYDDGFAAYLNGVLVGTDNSPEEPGWDATALTPRLGGAPLTPEEIDLTLQRGLLTDGENILAVHLLNAAPGDPDLFLELELLGYQRAISTNSWRYFVQSTPGAINGAGDTNLGPLILNIAHSPAVPKDSDAITVTARMQQTFKPIAELRLTYRVMYGIETNITMLDNGLSGDGAAGDGLYGAIIPANAASRGQMVRWYLRAIDTSSQVTRWPPYRDTRNSPQYLGTVISDPSLTNPLPVLHWFIQNPGSADGISGTRCSIFWNGVLYDNAFANLHGQSSQSFPKKSYNLDFNPGYHFQWSESETPVEDINLLTTYPDKAHVRNILAYETYKDAGHAYHFVVPVRVQRNGAFFSDAHMVEDGDADYLARVGLNPNGALYKMYNTFDSATSNVEKKTRRFEGNGDLSALLTGIRSANKTAYIYDNVNIPAMINFLAAMIVTGNVDCCHKNYYIYRDTGVTDEWQFVPWDQDLSFGRNWTSSRNYFDDTMYYQNALYIGNNNTLPAALFANSTFKNMYLRRLRTLLDEQMQAPGTPAAELKYEAKIRDLYDRISPDAALDYAKWSTWGTRQNMAQALTILTNDYFPKRRNYLYNTLGNTIPKPVSNEAAGFGALEFNPASGTQAHEYLTVTNGTSSYLDVSGWKVEGAVQHTFAPGTVLPPNGTIYLSPDVRAFRKRSVAPRGGQSLFTQGNYKGQLSARGETLRLADKSGTVLSTHSYSGAPTLAQQNLRIVEILFAPPSSALPGILAEDLEYVVLQNLGTTGIDLAGVHFTNGISFIFTNSLTLHPEERLYLAKNPAAFSSYYGTNISVYGPYLGQLANGGETLQLHDAVGENVLEFTYEKNWFAAVGSGASLLLANSKTAFDKFGEKSSWTISAYPGGSAGINQAWTTWRSQHFTAEELSSPASSAEADPDADGASNYAEFIAGTNPQASVDSLNVEIKAASATTLRFNVAAGREYHIDSANDLEGPWNPMSSLPRTEQSGPIQIPVTSGAETHFYRVRVNL